MKTWMLLVLFFAGLVSPLTAEEQVTAEPLAVSENHLPGVAVAQGITEITGVAISPLLGVSAVGSWQYFKAPADVRDDLPWYCQPWAWGTGFILLAMIFLKDTLGAAAPGILKKPFDMAELFENKASALVASAAFVPLVAREMSKGMEKVEVPAGMLGHEMMAAIDPAWWLVPTSLVAFGLVWVCSHAINVLIILSPFSLVDSMLKIARFGMLLTIGLMYWIAPWLGAALCVVIILIAAWLAPSALRLMIFGTRFAGDVLLPWRAKTTATPDRPHVFTLGSIGGLPSRTGGRLAMNGNGDLEFRYRRFCVMPETAVRLPDGERHIAKGLLSPAVFNGEEKQLLFLPRYRGREEMLVEVMHFKEVREHRLTRGLAAAKEWIRGALGSRRQIAG
ncbi:hypothetical protein ACFQY0_12225 [Haloferula chungangensis]|uniref:Uncharacterized protein n=1 Tax=Haloferula chungangensis TaxID=1048331 RepID=A0ABW2L6C5_9BACT